MFYFKEGHVVPSISKLTEVKIGRLIVGKAGTKEGEVVMLIENYETFTEMTT